MEVARRVLRGVINTQPTSLCRATDNPKIFTLCMYAD